MYFFDEDSWIIVGAELYGHDGTLKRFQEAFCKNYYEVPTCIFDFDVMYDFESGRYNIDHLKLGNGPANMDDAKSQAARFRLIGFASGDFPASRLERVTGASAN